MTARTAAQALYAAMMGHITAFVSSNGADSTTFRVDTGDIMAALDAAGWALVPKEPTEAMIAASAGALQDHIDALPDHIKNRYRNFKHGLKVSPKLKARVRYQAMLAAAHADIPASGPQTASLRVKPGF